jgi:hypothetical protein
VDHIPVYIGADALKRILYDAIIPKWNRWTENFPLCIDQIMMCDKLWVVLKPTAPDCDVIARNFFRSGKKGTQTFKTGKTIIHFHVPNEIYNVMINRKVDEELAAEQSGVAHDKIEYSLSGRADFMVRHFIKP